MRIVTTTAHLHALPHLKAVIDCVRAIEQADFTTQARDVLRERLDRPYDRADVLLRMGGNRHAAL